jgi:hypothetical protein
MITKEKFKEVLDFIYNGAILNLQNDKYLAPIAFISIQENEEKHMLSVVQLDFSTDEAKQMSMDSIKRYARKNNADGVFIVTEGWLAKVNKEGDESIRPRNRIDKQEGIVVSGVTPVMQGLITQVFTRVNDAIVLKEKEEYIGDGVRTEISLLSGIWETTH